MLKKCLIAEFHPLANEKNCIYWHDYRITVLQNRLIRLEKSENKKFRDVATQSVWFRNAQEQKFSVKEFQDKIIISTDSCSLCVKDNRESCYIIIDGKKKTLSNDDNLLGTARTLDMCDGDNIHPKMYNGDYEYTEKLKLENGVCSKSGVAVIDDTLSLAISSDGEIYKDDFKGSDEYIFAYGNDYNEAIKALYLITGKTPLIPRYALGNWWSRYHSYTQDEYLDLLDKFNEKNVPLTVATIDMDWHYSRDMENDFHITELGRDNSYYGGKNGWTGYTWNKNLFPDYKLFLKEVKKKNLKITLNLHPADGVRWWEDMYDDMADALGEDKSTLKHIPFDMTSDKFINAYFDILHKPYEKDGVSFWWIDWQQGTLSKIEGLDPLWTLNHYHYLDNGENHKVPLILSRYSGIGSHRYPLGFSGDTIVTWDTLKYLPYFTATASNIGYTWWSHDIGGHMWGIQDNQLFLRSIQFGVFSPINRLHSGRALTTTKEPWAYKNGCGELAMKFLRLRHRMIPFLYTQAYLTHKTGKPLVEPLYYKHKEKQAYSYKNEYYFGDLLVSPVTSKINKDGFSKVKMWIPEGYWTDIFTGVNYKIEKGGKETTLYRTLESIPVLAKAGTILPMSEDKGNSVMNPVNLTVNVFNGNGEFCLYEDNTESEEKTIREAFTKFTCSVSEDDKICRLKLNIKSSGEKGVIPENRIIKILFRNVTEGDISVFADNEKIECSKCVRDCLAVKLNYDFDKQYNLIVSCEKQTDKSEIINNVRKIIMSSEDDNCEKVRLYDKILKINSKEEYEEVIDQSKLKAINKNVLKEFI